MEEERKTPQLLKYAQEGRLTKHALASMLTPEPRRQFLEACAAIEKRYTDQCGGNDPCLQAGCSVEGEICLQPILRAGTEYHKACAAEWEKLFARHENRLYLTVPYGWNEVDVAVTGRDLLDNALLNKGSAFTDAERREFGLLGLLPPHVSTVEEQLARTYENYKRKDTDLERYIFLASLQDRNEALFYMLVQRHISEMMPVIYTPVVGEGCRYYSHIYRRPRGLYISYPHAREIDDILRNAPCTEPAVIVVTDGERILGLGDLGVGGMGISIGKLSLYSVCAGIHPSATLPIVLDVGTNNGELRNDPLYLGWRHERLSRDAYDAFVEQFVSAVIRRFPRTLLQWEDFSKNNAARLLAKYRDRLCTFNDDIQGTAAVTLAGLLSAARATGTELRDHRVAILGAGSSAIGISDNLVAVMRRQGLTDEAARAAIWLVDSEGLVHVGRTNLDASKARYAQPIDRIAEWTLERENRVGLMDVITHVRPTVLIGVSAQPGAFTEPMIRAMAAGGQRPIIFPLSNPTSKAEAVPQDVIAWTGGRAFVATGSPFPDVQYRNRQIRIGQCNNAFIFPGIGLGVIASRARRVTDEMCLAAADALHNAVPALADSSETLYPPLERTRQIAQAVAVGVALEAQRSGVAAPASEEEIRDRITATMWTPGYPRFNRVPSLLLPA